MQKAVKKTHFFFVTIILLVVSFFGLGKDREKISEGVSTTHIACADVPCSNCGCEWTVEQCNGFWIHLHTGDSGGGDGI